MEYMPIFGLLGSFIQNSGGDSDAPAPAPIAEPKKPMAPTITQPTAKASNQQKAAVRDNRVARTGLDTRSGLSILGSDSSKFT